MTALHAAGGGLPLALHIPNVVEQAGAIAGFAAIIGLAVLSTLYFSQARDLRRLREWAGRAPERAAEAQPGPVPGRVVATPQQRPPQTAPATPAAAAAAGAKPANGAPAADAGKSEEAKEGVAASNGDAAPSVAAAPGADAEKAEGDADAEKSEDGKPGEVPAGAKPGMPAPASAAAAAAGAGAKSVTGPAAPGSAPANAPGSAPGPAPANAPGSAPGSAPANAPGSAPTGTAGAAGAAAAAGAASPPKPGAPAQPQRPPGSVLPPRTGTLPPVRRLPSSNVGASQTGVLGSATPPPEKKKRNPVYVVLAVAGVIVLGAAAAIGVPALVNGSKDDNSSKSASSTSSAKTTATKATPVAPDKITVAVLNGTAIPGLAAQVGDRVDAEGFTLGTVSNASQSNVGRANSAVMYAKGHTRDARQVARKLNISNVTPVDAESRSIAGDASVVVIVGSDKTQ